MRKWQKFFCNSKNRDCKTCHTYLCGTLKENCSYIALANKLVDMGYGNIKQAVKEFVDEAKDKIRGEEMDDEWVWDILDELFYKLYGADE